jgi:sugar (pentulose or hexulose) kinase
VREAASQMIPVGTVYEPNPKLRDVYDEGYQHYQAAYDALCPVFDQMAGDLR